MIGTNKRKDIFAILTFVISFFIIYFVITKGKFLYGSSIDWESQHYLIPEYFRNLFYQTKNLFPDFAPHLGAGENIYYFSYYGLYSPIILFSYLLPFVKMIDYIQAVGMLLPIVSTTLFYFYLRKHHNFSISFFVSLLFLFSGPIIFHSHRHLMFISYFPFYMMGLFGIDQFFNKNKIFLLTLACTLMLFTSYYYSVGAFISLFCYGIYIFIRDKKFTIKKFIQFTLPFIIAIMACMILILPTLYTLLNGRDSNSTISLFTLFMPKRSLRFLFYGSYGIGTTCISLISILYLITTKKRENIYLGILLLVISIFPIFNYVFNGTLYIDAKSLIPFLPLVLICVSYFLNDLFEHKISWKLIFCFLFMIGIFTTSKLVYIDLFCLTILFLSYFKLQNKNIFLAVIVVLSFLVCIGTNLADSLSAKSKVTSLEYLDMDDAIEYITSVSSNSYRINNRIAKGYTMNKIMNANQFVTTIYSSTFNKEYNSMFFDVFNNEIPYRNRSITPASSNPLFQMFMGEKYVISSDIEPYLSTEIYATDNLKVYELKHVLPIGYARSNVISKSEYETLSYPNNVLTLLSGIVADSGSGDTIRISKEELDYEVVGEQNISIVKTEDGYQVDAKKNASLTLKLNHYDSSKILLLRFKNEYNPSCHKKELAITINGVKNKLTCSSWKYHNKNYEFDYVLYGSDTLSITFEKGHYELSDFEFYFVDEDLIDSFFDDVDEFYFDEDSNLTKGTIDVSNDGYFTLSIPYDKGFVAFVDGKEVEVEKVNEAFIGFPITKGHHTIEIVYHAPYKRVGSWISLFGIIVMLGIFLHEKRM